MTPHQQAQRARQKVRHLLGAWDGSGPMDDAICSILADFEAWLASEPDEVLRAIVHRFLRSAVASEANRRLNQQPQTSEQQVSCRGSHGWDEHAIREYRLT